jgi:hypothetical protein
VYDHKSYAFLPGARHGFAGRARSNSTFALEK